MKRSASSGEYSNTAGERCGHLVLRDGTPVEVRQLEPADRAGLAAATERLSSETIYQRFASPKPHLTERELDTLTDLDHHRREALVAVDPATQRGVAVARYAELPDEPGVADVAVTVDDAWQGRGLGGALLRLLIGRAENEGFVALRATVLAENVRSLAMLRGVGFRGRGFAGPLRELALPFTRSSTARQGSDTQLPRSGY